MFKPEEKDAAALGRKNTFLKRTKKRGDYFELLLGVVTAFDSVC